MNAPTTTTGLQQAALLIIRFLCQSSCRVAQGCVMAWVLVLAAGLGLHARTSAAAFSCATTIAHPATAPSSDGTATMLAITMQPMDQYDCSSNMAVFTVGAVGATGYQWFRSADNGENWVQLANGDYGLLSGVFTPTLTASGGSLAVLNGLLFRCRVSDGVTTINSEAASFRMGAPATSIQYDESFYCTGASPAAVTLAGVQGGVFSATPMGLNIHASTGQIIPGSSTPNTYTVTYSVPAQHGCAAIQATAIVGISDNVQPVISYGADPLCFDATAVPVTFSGAGGGVFSASPMGLAINSATGVINPSASAVGDYTVTYTTDGSAASGCSAYTAMTTVTTYTHLNAVITGGGNHACAGGSYNLTVTGTPNSIVTYKINGGADLTLTLGDTGSAVLNTGPLRENTSYQLVSMRFADTQTCERTLTSTANITFDRPYLTYAVSAPAFAVEGEVVNVNITNRPFTIILYQINGGFVQSALINNETGLISIPVTVNGTTTFTRFSSVYQGMPNCSTTYPDSAAVVISVEACPPVGTTWYVNAAASAGGDGSSWACAFRDLQDAIDAASSGHEIWVKAGTYLPTKDPFGNASPADPRDRTFYLKDGVGVYGGFAGTETLRSERDWEANPTVLSGDIGTVGVATDNSYHVVISVNDAATTVLDGFKIEKGYADAPTGITIEGLVINRIFGGGMHNRSSSPTVSNCAFLENHTENYGGGMYNVGVSTIAITNCAFLSNSAVAGGGGGMYNHSNVNVTLTDCIFSGNQSNSQGGAMSNYLATLNLANCLLSGNAANSGGGMYNYGTTMNLINCTLTGNDGNFVGGGMANTASSQVDLKNCILWNNRLVFTSAAGDANFYVPASSTAVVSYSLIQNQNPAGTGNLDGTGPMAGFANYPNFITPLDPTAAPSTAGDFQLATCSPAANVGNNIGVTATDLAGNPRIFNTTVDLGAYERTTNGTAPTTWYADTDGDTFGNSAVSVVSCLQPTGYVANNTDCDDTDDAINPNTTWYKDADNDGYAETGAATITQCAPPMGYKLVTELLASSGDCNDNNDAILPGATEICNGVDDNCDGNTDEGLAAVTYYQDSDNDGFGNPMVSQSTCDGAPMGYVANNTDCDDTNDAINPNTTWYKDADNDGYAETGAATITQCVRPTGYKLVTELLASSGDCNDNNDAILPGATEICNGVDDNCDGNTDEGLAFITYYQDSDNDGFGNPMVSQSTCDGAPMGYVANNTDCDDTNDAINPNTIWYKDADNDGYAETGAATITQCARPTDYKLVTELQASSGDCNDNNDAILPGATEICNGLDDDCDGTTDNDVTFSRYYFDGDEDSFGDTNLYQDLCAPIGFYTALVGGDCDDSNADINPDALEVCDNEDNNCDGMVDENLINRYYLDGDEDGFGHDNMYQDLCAPTGSYTALVGGDCDDDNADINPDAMEICNGLDDDCDGTTDDNVTTYRYYFDSDQDGFGDASLYQDLCAPTGSYTALVGDDCNDSDDTVYPDAPEICDGKDNDCDGTTDEGVITRYYRDADSDGFGNPTQYIDGCAPTDFYTVLIGGDCDDEDDTVYPDAPEICDGKDNDCNGTIDDGLTTRYYHDLDGDGYGEAASYIDACAPSGFFTATEIGDCAANDADVYPGATEICDGKDNDCNGIIDDGLTTRYYYDLDGDGYGESAFYIDACVPSGFFTATEGGDCAADDADVYPGAPEICDGKDNDCNGTIDDDLTTRYYYDLDGDGYGEAYAFIDACIPSGLYTATEAGDCAADDADVYPGAPELCDGKDNDCNGTIDDGVTTRYYYDFDGDGYGEAYAFIDACIPSGFYTATEVGDCAADDADIYPGATEICDGKDNNCDGAIDEGLITRYFYDNDGDGYGQGLLFIDACAPDGIYTATLGGDCNDDDASVNPGVMEVCNDIDDDCDGVTDNGFPIIRYYYDGDADGFGESGAFRDICGPLGFFTATVGGDCNDGDHTIYPDAPELCDGKDNDCNGTIDDGVTTRYYYDFDGDGYGEALFYIDACVPSGFYTAMEVGDCVADDADVYPGAPELCDGKDNDCNGIIDDGLTTRYYYDVDGDGYGEAIFYIDACAPSGFYTTTEVGDCSPYDADVYPGAPELCDGKDNDCDGTIDNGPTFVTYYLDADGDGFGNPDVSQNTCDGAPVGYVGHADDCDDTNDAINPNTVWYLDADDDGYYTGAGITQCTSPGMGYRYTGILGSDDCDDSNAALSPGLSTCVQDCNGDFGGTAFLDNCATCVGGNTGEVACTQDCNGDYGGTAFLDNCGVCSGGNTGLVPDASCLDCAGVPNGPAQPGTACDDGDATTINDTWDNDCQCAGTSTLILSGNVVWEHDVDSPVDTVTVTLSGGDTGSDYTDAWGDYAITTSGGNLTVTPTKNDNPRQGVDAADAARIRQHALGMLLFNDGYKVIAADVNENNTVTNADATIIQQALMGNAGAGNLLDNPAWRFVDAAHTFANENAPWGFPMNVGLTGVAAAVPNIDFVGVKMGDVNGTWGGGDGLVAQPAVWLVANEHLEAGSTHRVAFALGEDLDDVAAWQFALRLDPVYATVSRIIPKAVFPLTREDFGTANLLNGELRTVFAQAQGEPLKAGEVVFELELTVRRSGVLLSDILTLDNNILDGRVYDTALKGGLVKLAFAPARDKPGLPTVPTYAEAAFELYQNVPNPFADETVIAFSLPADAAAIVTIHDANGRVVAQLFGDYAAGYNTVRLTRDVLKGTTGVLTYTVTAGTYTATRRMVVVE